MKCKKGYRREGNKCVKRISSIVKSPYVNNNYSGGGIGFLGLLTLIFITLKLTKVINWSWLWILSPLWIPVLSVLIISLIVFIIIKLWWRE